MKTYDIRAEDGCLLGFEVSNVVIGRRGLCRLLGTIPGVQITRRPVLLSWFRDDDVFCTFDLDGVSFVVEEPYGDSSRYWITSKGTRAEVPLNRVRDVFARARPFQFVL